MRTFSFINCILWINCSDLHGPWPCCTLLHYKKNRVFLTDYFWPAYFWPLAVKFKVNFIWYQVKVKIDRLFLTAFIFDQNRSNLAPIKFIRSNLICGSPKKSEGKFPPKKIRADVINFDRLRSKMKSVKFNFGRQNFPLEVVKFFWILID